MQGFVWLDAKQQPVGLGKARVPQQLRRELRELQIGDKRACVALAPQTLLRIVFGAALQGWTIVVATGFIFSVAAAVAGAPQRRTVVVAVVVELMFVLDLRQASFDSLKFGGIEHVLGPRRQDGGDFVLRLGYAVRRLGMGFKSLRHETGLLLLQGVNLFEKRNKFL